jgi:hypothetical protein
MPEIIVRVLTEGEFVECVRRKRLSLPDGREAVLYGRSLFPIRQPGPHIDVSGDNDVIEDVTRLESGAPINHTIRLYLDCSGGTARLMIDGDAVVKDFVAATLDEASVFAQEVNVLNVPADDGHLYDWCLEFEKSAFATELKRQLDTLSAARHDRFCRSKAPSTAATQAANAGLTSANVEVTQSGLRRPESPEHVPATEELNQLAECNVVIERFRQLLSVDAPHAVREGSPLSAAKIATWRERVADGPKIANELLEELIAAEGQARELTQELDDVVSERDRLQLRVRKKLSMSKVLSETFPEIQFVEDSTEVIDENFSSAKSLGSVLRAIVNDDPATRTTAIKGATQTWYEVHVATGKRSNGRVYFHRSSNSKIQVLVSFKGDQKQDTALIRSLS